MLRVARLLGSFSFSCLQNTKRQKEDHHSYHYCTLKFFVLTCKPIADTKMCPEWLPFLVAGTMLGKKATIAAVISYDNTPLNTHWKGWM